MAQRLASTQDGPGIRAAYIRNESGKLCITFDDPAYVRSDLIIFERGDNSLHAVLHESSHFIGHVEGDLAEAFAVNDEVLLVARHGGRVIDLVSPLSVKAAQK